MKKLIQDSNISTITIVIIAIGFIFCSCIGKGPSYPNTPIITFKEMSKNRAKDPKLTGGVSDTINVWFSFTDGDGDLSFPENSDNDPNNDTADVYFQDSRAAFNNYIWTYKLPKIDPASRIKAISGDIIVAASQGLFCEFDTTITLDTVRFTVWIQDRAGNTSNKFTTDEIIIQCK